MGLFFIIIIKFNEFKNLDINAFSFKYINILRVTEFSNPIAPNITSTKLLFLNFLVFKIIF